MCMDEWNGWWMEWWMGKQQPKLTTSKQQQRQHKKKGQDNMNNRQQQQKRQATTGWQQQPMMIMHSTLDKNLLLRKMSWAAAVAAVSTFTQTIITSRHWMFQTWTSSFEESSGTGQRILVQRVSSTCWRGMKDWWHGCNPRYTEFATLCCLVCAIKFVTRFICPISDQEFEFVQVFGSKVTLWSLIGYIREVPWKTRSLPSTSMESTFAHCRCGCRSQYGGTCGFERDLSTWKDWARYFF